MRIICCFIKNNYALKKRRGLGKRNQRDLAHRSSEILVKLQPTRMEAKGIFFFPPDEFDACSVPWPDSSTGASVAVISLRLLGCACACVLLLAWI